MKRLVVGGAILALGVAGAGISQAGTTDGQGAQKASLVEVTPQGMHACDSAKSAADTGAATGFAILNGAGKVGEINKIVGEVSLKAGTPDTMYMVFLAQAGSGSGDDGMCKLTGTLTTNGEGKGNSHIDSVKSAISVPGQGGEYYVVLRNGADEIYATTPVSII